MVPSIQTPDDGNKTALYHFANVKNFEKIYTQKKILLTSCLDIKNSTDETKALLLATTDILKSKEYGDKVREQYNLSNDEIISKIVTERKRTYIACFSTTSSSETIFDTKFDKLWEKYADHSQGVAIELNWRAFPIQTSITSNILPNGARTRTTQSRMIDMIYDEKILAKELTKFSCANLHSLHLDTYKPTKCEGEHEKRLLLYLSLDDNDTRLPDGFDRISDRIYYTFSPGAITKVFCKSEKTYKKLCDLTNRHELIQIATR